MRRAATVAGLSCDARKPVDTFYDDWEKIRAVLNDNGFVRASDPPEELVTAPPRARTGWSPTVVAMCRK